VKTAADIETKAFTQFASRVAPRLTNALVSLLGLEHGQDATWDALTHAWENWEEVSAMGNPVGYLYVVGRNGARRSRKQPVVFPDPPADRTPWVEPGLSSALVDLPSRQRQAVILVHGYGWTLSEVATVLGVQKTTVQKHVERGVSKLRQRLGVSL
jgi:DNA-directed RNA polymerase specialized sigma24 family protein